jgi:hypothetical protein
MFPGELRFLVETLPGERTPHYVFETSAGVRFSVPRTEISSQQEVEILDALRDEDLFVERNGRELG